MSGDKSEKEEKGDTRRWRERLRRSKQYQDDYSKNWTRNEKLIYGHSAGEPDSKDIIVAWGYGLAKSLETAIYIQDPEGIAEAYDAMLMARARLWTNIINYDLSVMDIKSKGNMGILDNFIYGYFAVIETVKTDRVIRYKGEEVGKKGRKTKPENREIESAAIRGQIYDPLRIHPRDILFDPQGLRVDLTDQRYVATAFYPTVGALQDDPLFKDNLPEDIEEFPECTQVTRKDKKNSYQSPGGDSGDEKDPDFKTICVWEIHDPHNGELLYFTDHKHEPIGRMKRSFDISIEGRKYLPITLMAFNPSPVGFYPTPEVDLIASQLGMLNRLDAMIYEDALTKWRKFGAIGGVVDADINARITDPSPANAVIILDKDTIGELAGVDKGGYPDGANFLFPIPDPSVKQDQLAVRDMLIQEISEIIGYGPSARGGLPKTRSAREAMAIKERQDSRLHLRAAAITDFYGLFIKKHMQIVQQTMEVERYVPIFPSDAQGLALMKQYGKDDIQGRFGYVIFAGSTMPKDTESKRATERDLFGLVAPALQAAGLPIAPAVLRLASAYQWRNVDEIFKDYKTAAKELALLSIQMQSGTKLPPQALPNAIAKIVMACLNAGEMNEIKQIAAKGAAQGGGGGGGMAPPSTGGQPGDPNPNGTAAGAMPVA